MALLRRPRFYRMPFQMACVVCGIKTRERVSHHFVALEKNIWGAMREVIHLPEDRMICHRECHEQRCPDLYCVHWRTLVAEVMYEAEILRKHR